MLKSLLSSHFPPNQSVGSEIETMLLSVDVREPVRRTCQKRAFCLAASGGKDGKVLVSCMYGGGMWFLSKLLLAAVLFGASKPWLYAYGRWPGVCTR